MTATETAPKPALAAGFNPYLMMGYLSLAVIFLAQLSQGLLLGNLVVVATGAFCLFTRMRRGPLFFLAFLATVHVGYHAWMYQRLFFQLPRRLFDPADVALCIGVLGYVAAHYRMQSMLVNVLSPDPRRRSGPPRKNWLGITRPAPIRHLTRQTASELHIQKEMALLLLALPFWAIVAQLAFYYLTARWEFLELPNRLVQFLVLIWALAAGVILLATLLSLWKRRRMDPIAAQMLLQDTLWHDTRSEQRRVNRWLAWQKNKR